MDLFNSDWRTAALNLINQNAKSLDLTGDEQYALGWGDEALSDSWIREKSKKIRGEIDSAKSTDVLRRKTDRSATSDQGGESGESGPGGAANPSAAGVSASKSGNGGVSNNGGAIGAARDGDGAFDGSIDSSLNAANLMRDLSKVPLGVIPKIALMAGDAIATQNAFNILGRSADANKNAAAASSLPGGSAVQTVSDVHGNVRTVSNDKTIADQDARSFGYDGDSGESSGSASSGGSSSGGNLSSMGGAQGVRSGGGGGFGGSSSGSSSSSSGSGIGGSIGGNLGSMGGGQGVRGSW